MSATSVLSAVEMTLEEVTDLVNSSDSKCGSFNYFFKINEELGLKLTKSQERRDENYAAQSRAAMHELGPRAFGKIDGVTFHGAAYYGYFTEVVTTYYEEIANMTSIEKDEHFNQALEERETLTNELLEKAGFTWSDRHFGNIGYLKHNNKMVCVDFDHL
jgi:predicted unusual protein kinase regulating ubiquinone biosynthesis (AarF/ABC1/UbiB family)